MPYTCTDYSLSENWSFGEYRLIYNFGWYANRRIKIGTTSCCWIAPFHYRWSLGTSFTIATRSDTGQINSSPRAITSPVLRIQQGCFNVIALPVSDPDGDIVRCRWDRRDWFPGAELDSNTCTITYSGYRTGNLVASLVLEDFAPGSSTPFSSVELQFLIYVVPFSGSCGQAPQFIDPTPPQGTCIINSPGVTYTARLMATTGSSSISIHEIQTASPRGLSKGPIRRVSGTNNYYVDITWTPDSSQYGQTYQFCYAAVNSRRISSTQICIQIMSGFVPPIPDRSVLQPSRVTWRIDFDKNIQRPTMGASIIFFDFSTNVEVYRVNAASATSEVIFDQQQSILIRPNYAFVSGRRYYFNFQEGVVVSPLGCRPGNLPIANGRTYWIFTSPPTVTADTNGMYSNVHHSYCISCTIWYYIIKIVQTYLFSAHTYQHKNQTLSQNNFFELILACIG